MSKCARCEKTGDLACISMLDEIGGKPETVIALHADGTVEVPDASELKMLAVLSFIGKVWMETSFALAVLHRAGLSNEQYARDIEAGFLKLRYYGTMDGAVRERMRAAGMKLPTGAIAPTQKAARA